MPVSIAPNHIVKGISSIWSGMEVVCGGDLRQWWKRKFFWCEIDPEWSRQQWRSWQTETRAMIDTMTSSSRIDCLIPGEVIGSSGEHCNGPDIRRINSGGDVIISPCSPPLARLLSSLPTRSRTKKPSSTSTPDTSYGDHIHCV